SRLRDLVRDGILDRARSEGDSGRVEYRLTRKGLELYPVLIAMMRWGDTWLSGESGPPLTLIHRVCGAKTAPEMVCSHCGERLTAREVVAVARRAAPARVRRAERAGRKRAGR